jgi:hypothetical protein
MVFLATAQVKTSVKADLRITLWAISIVSTNKYLDHKLGSNMHKTDSLPRESERLRTTRSRGTASR